MTRKKWLHTWRGRPRLGRLPWGPRQGEAGHWPPPPRPTGKWPKSSWQLKQTRKDKSVLMSNFGQVGRFFARLKVRKCENLCQWIKINFCITLNATEGFIFFGNFGRRFYLRMENWEPWDDIYLPVFILKFLWSKLISFVFTSMRACKFLLKGCRDTKVIKFHLKIVKKKSGNMSTCPSVLCDCVQVFK